MCARACAAHTVASWRRSRSCCRSRSHVVLTSFKRTRDLIHGVDPLLFNEAPTLDHWKLLFTGTLYLRWVANTLAVGLLVVAITLLLAVPAAYGLARLLGIGMFLMYLVPPTLLFIPLSRACRAGRPPGLALGRSCSSSFLHRSPSRTTWLLMGFFKSIPRDLEDAAMVDGLLPVFRLRQGDRSDLVLRPRDGLDLLLHSRPRNSSTRSPSSPPHRSRRSAWRSDPPGDVDHWGELTGRCRLRPGRDGVQPVSRPADPGIHRGGGQVTARRTRAVILRRVSAEGSRTRPGSRLIEYGILRAFGPQDDARWRFALRGSVRDPSLRSG